MTLTRFNVELRSQLDGNTLVGHAAVFGQVAKVPGHYERIDPHAFDAALADRNTDVRALVNHDPSLLLGRSSAGTLRLSVDGEGLAFEVDLPDTSYARDLRELIGRGDLTGASFGFIPGADKWEAVRSVQVRTHLSVKALMDVSAVTFPAYGDASVSLRHHDFARDNNRDRLIRARARVALRGLSK